MSTTFDALIIGTGQAGPALAGRLAGSFAHEIEDVYLAARLGEQLHEIAQSHAVPQAEARFAVRDGPEFALEREGKRRCCRRIRCGGATGRRRRSGAGEGGEAAVDELVEACHAELLRMGPGRLEQLACPLPVAGGAAAKARAAVVVLGAGQIQSALERPNVLFFALGTFFVSVAAGK